MQDVLKVADDLLLINFPVDLLHLLEGLLVLTEESRMHGLHFIKAICINLVL